MDELILHKKTLNDYFELLDYQRDFLALKAACEKMQAKLAKIKIATSAPDGVDSIIDDGTSSFTTTYSSEKVEDLFSTITSDVVIAKEKIVTAINAKKPSSNAKVEDTWDLLAFYISLMGNLQFEFKETVLNKIRVTSYISNINECFPINHDGMSNPYLYKAKEYSITATMDNSYKSIQNMTITNIKMNNLEIYLGSQRVF